MVRSLNDEWPTGSLPIQPPSPTQKPRRKLVFRPTRPSGALEKPAKRGGLLAAFQAHCLLRRRIGWQLFVAFGRRRVEGDNPVRRASEPAHDRRDRPRCSHDEESAQLAGRPKGDRWAITTRSKE